jgi:hypothetical protein
MALQEPIDVSLSLPSASQWKKAHLDYLNAEYDRHLVSDLSFGDIVIPTDFQRRMTHSGYANLVDIDIIANELEKVNDSNEITVDFEFDILEHPSISLFDAAFDTLEGILRKTPEHFSLEATFPDALRTPPPQTTTPASPHQTPPAYVVNPTNPPLSTSTASSSESQHETNTHIYAYLFLWASIRLLKQSLQKFSWFDKSYKLKTEFVSASTN